jgi:hypothetical protein
MEIRCMFCALRLDTNKKGVAFEVTGWLERRNQGGANHIRHKAATGRWAHNACLEGERIDYRQTTIEDFLNE